MVWRSITALAVASRRITGAAPVSAAVEADPADTGGFGHIGARQPLRAIAFPIGHLSDPDHRGSSMNPAWE